MQIDIMSFTRRGIELSAKIRECLYSCGKGYEVCLYTKYGRYQEISDAEIQTEWIREHNRANGKIRFMSKKASTTGCARVSNKTEMGKDSSHLDRRMRNRGARHGTFSA